MDTARSARTLQPVPADRLTRAGGYVAAEAGISVIGAVVPLRSGIASRLLEHIIDEARRMGFARMSLETGSADFFLPARRLYEKFGFTYCEPFGDYRPDPNSVFMTRTL